MIKDVEKVYSEVIKPYMDVILGYRVEEAEGNKVVCTIDLKKPYLSFTFEPEIQAFISLENDIKEQLTRTISELEYVRQYTPEAYDRILEINDERRVLRLTASKLIYK